MGRDSEGSCPLFLRPLPLFQRSLAPAKTLAELERSAPGGDGEVAVAVSVAGLHVPKAAVVSDVGERLDDHHGDCKSARADECRGR